MVNHEIPLKYSSTPLVGETPHQGALVSRLQLRRVGGQWTVESGDIAYDAVKGGPTPLSRLCSGYLAGPQATIAGGKPAFDEIIYFCGEEAAAPETADGKGGRGVAIIGREAHLLQDLGRYQKENIIALPGMGERTVLFPLEDGPAGYVSQLYMYVGSRKQGSADPLERHGLKGGKLYVFKIEGLREEIGLLKGNPPVEGRWVEIPGAADMHEDELEKASSRAGALGFWRIEDGTYDRNERGVFYFCTTGTGIAGDANRCGRLYRLRFDADNPAAGASLQVLLDGSEGVVNPDNLDLNYDGQMLIQEDPVDENRGAFMHGRDSSIWLFDLATGALTRVVEINQGAVVPKLRTALGGWETSGVIDVSRELGERGLWLINVQAHSVRLDSTLEGGQLLLLKLE